MALLGSSLCSLTQMKPPRASPYRRSLLAEMVCRMALSSYRGMLVLLATLLASAGLIPAAYPDGQLDAEVNRLHEAVGKDQDLSLERRLEMAARTASLIANQMYCKTGEVDGPSCRELEKNADKVAILKDWASRAEGWERTLASLSLFHVGRGFWYQENYDRSLLAVEQSIALKLFPYQTAEALELWQRALVHPKSWYSRQRQELADALVLQADCLLEMGQGDRNIAQLEKAMQALQLAAALVHNNKEASPDTYTQMTVMAMQIASAAVDVLNRLRMSSIHELMDTHGVSCKGCTDKVALLRQLVPRLNLPVVMLSETSPLISPLEDPLANDMLPTLKSEHETQQQYMQRQFRSLLGLVHSHLLEELQVACARRTQEGFCASYQPPWTWERAGGEPDPPAGNAIALCSAQQVDPSGSPQWSSARACRGGESHAELGSEAAAGQDNFACSPSSNRSHLPSCQPGALPCMPDPEPSTSHWNPSGGPASESAESVHLGGVDTIIFTSSGSKFSHPKNTGAQGAAHGGALPPEAKHGGGGIDPRAARHFAPGSFHDAVRETLDRQLREQLAKKADAASQHDDPLVLLTLFGCILGCMCLCLFIKHKRRISRFLQVYRGWLSSSSVERSAGMASLGASSTQSPSHPSGHPPTVMQSRKSVAALLREALAGPDVAKVEAAYETALEVGLEPTSSLLQRAHAVVQQKKRRERSQQQGAKAVSSKKEKVRKTKLGSDRSGFVVGGKDAPVAGSDDGVSNASLSRLPSMKEQAGSRGGAFFWWPLNSSTAGKEVAAFDPEPARMPSSEPPLGQTAAHPPDARPPASTSQTRPPPSTQQSKPDSKYTATRSTLPKYCHSPATPYSAHSTANSTAQSTAHSSDTDTVDGAPQDMDHMDDWQETIKKPRLRGPDHKPLHLLRRTSANSNAANEAITSVTRLSAALLAQLPSMPRQVSQSTSSSASQVSAVPAASPPAVSINHVSQQSLPQSLSQAQPSRPPSQVPLSQPLPQVQLSPPLSQVQPSQPLSQAQPSQPPLQPPSRPQTPACSPAYPPSMPIPTPVTLSPQLSPTPSWLSWLSSTGPVQPSTKPDFMHTLSPSASPALPFSTASMHLVNLTVDPKDGKILSFPMDASAVSTPSSYSSSIQIAAVLPAAPSHSPAALNHTAATITQAPASHGTPGMADVHSAKGFNPTQLEPLSNVVSSSDPTALPQMPHPVPFSPSPARPVLYKEVVLAKANQPSRQASSGSGSIAGVGAAAAVGAGADASTAYMLSAHNGHTVSAVSQAASTQQPDSSMPARLPAASQEGAFPPSQVPFPPDQAGTLPTSLDDCLAAVPQHSFQASHGQSLTSGQPRTGNSHMHLPPALPHQDPAGQLPLPFTSEKCVSFTSAQLMQQPTGPFGSTYDLAYDGYAQLTGTVDAVTPPQLHSSFHQGLLHDAEGNSQVVSSGYPHSGLPELLPSGHASITCSQDPACSLVAYDPVFPGYACTQPSSHPTMPGRPTSSTPVMCATLDDSSFLHIGHQQREPMAAPSLLPTSHAVTRTLGADTGSSLAWPGTDVVTAGNANEGMAGLGGVTGGSLWDPLVSFDMDGSEDAWSSNTKRLQEWLQVDPGITRGAAVAAVSALHGDEVALGASPPDSLGDANEWIHDLLKHVMD